MPTLRLDMDTGRELKVVLGGSLSNANERSLLTHTLQGARVQDTGKYSCVVNNGIGRDAFSSISLYVKGPPAALRESFSLERDNYPFINYRGSPETLRFDVLTYEVPNRYLFVLLGMDPKADAGMPPRLGVLKSECVAGDVLQTTQCSVTANNVTEYDVGFYNLTLENSMGSLRVTFHLMRYAAQDTESNTESQSKLQFGLGIGFGTAALAIVFLAIAFIYKWRRHKGAQDKRPSISKPDHSNKDAIDASIIFEESENAYDALGLNETTMHTSYMELHGYTNLKEDRRISNEYEVPVTSSK